MIRSHFTSTYDDDSSLKGLSPVGPVYGGILDSPLVFTSAFDPPPITPPESGTIPSLCLPFDTSSAIPESEHSHSEPSSPVSPPWPSTPPSGDDDAMCISDPDSTMLVLNLLPEAYAPLHQLAPFKDSYHDAYHESMDVDSEFGSHEGIEELVDDDEPYDFTASPLYSPPPELDEDDGLSPTSPLSPCLDFDEIPDLAPCSPTLRLNTSLPQFQDESKLFSSTIGLFSLPGADVDEDLISSDLGLPKTSTGDEVCEPPVSPSSFGGPSLLMLNSGANIPIPPTPSPDQLDIDVGRLDEYPDLRRLAILRKKSQEMEKGLKVVEEQMLQQGEVQARADIRRERKWHKERSREITAMLKLIVGDDIFSRPAGSSLPAVHLGKKTIATMDHLVARMVYKRRERNDLPRPISSASRGPLEKTRHASRLSQCITTGQSD